jgi:two-component system, OmpR family, alkaline phosphatase synthesis response regulator PhoP
MVVDDDRIIANLLSHTLGQRGFSVEVSTNGREAMEKLENAPPPKIILLDIILPYMDGFEILHQIRSNKNWQSVPIIMLTSKTQEHTIVRAFESGADDYLTKPFQIEELMVRIRRLLK